MSTSVLRVVAEEAHRELPMPAYAYGVMAMVGFLVLLGVLYSFRNTHQKWAPPGEGHGAHGQVGQGAHAAIEDASSSKHGH